MKIEKLPSGSYRIRKTYQKKTYTVVTDYKPTQKEAMRLLADEMDKAHGKYARLTFEAAGKEYIESKRNVLSPSTIKEYTGTLGRLSKKFLELNVHDITQLDIQTEINKISAKRSPKTVRNYHGFISAVLGIYCPNLKINTTLPQKTKSCMYIPCDDDVRRILEAAKGTAYEIPLILACYGMRRSEICALLPEDIERDVVHITKAMVQDDRKDWVIKSTKTTASTRDIIIPEQVAEQIRARGYVYKGHPNNITDFLSRTQKKMEIPHFSIHKLRHYFASKMSALHIPDENIMKFGGWETDYVMKGVYRHALQDKNNAAQREASRILEKEILS